MHCSIELRFLSKPLSFDHLRDFFSSEAAPHTPNKLYSLNVVGQVKVRVRVNLKIIVLNFLKYTYLHSCQ